MNKPSEGIKIPSKVEKEGAINNVIPPFVEAKKILDLEIHTANSITKNEQSNNN